MLFIENQFEIRSIGHITKDIQCLEFLDALRRKYKIEEVFVSHYSQVGYPDEICYDSKEYDMEKFLRIIGAYEGYLYARGLIDFSENNYEVEAEMCPIQDYVKRTNKRNFDRVSVKGIKKVESVS